MKSSVTRPLKLALICLGASALSAGTPDLIRPSLQFDTESRSPRWVGVPQLTVSPAGVPVTYYKVLSFSGGQDIAEFSSDVTNPYRQSQNKIGGSIIHYYDSATDTGKWTVAAWSQSGEVLGVKPWEYHYPFVPSPPVLTVMIPLGPQQPAVGYAGENNPFNLPVESAIRAAEENIFRGGTFGGRFTVDVEWQHYRAMELSSPDSKEEAEARARVTKSKDVRLAAAVTSIHGTPQHGNPWMIRTVHVTARFVATQGCAGETYKRHATYQRRPVGTAAWVESKSLFSLVSLKASQGVATDEFDLPLELGFELRLADLTYEAVTSDCASCDGGTGWAGGTNGPAPGSIRWNIPLGSTATGESAGVLSLFADHVNAALYTPAALEASINAEAAVVVRNGQGVLRQILAAQALADIVPTGPQSYEIRFFGRADVGDPDNDGVYATSGNAYLTWRIENPGTAGSGLWKVTRLIGSQQLVTLVDESVSGRTVFSEAGGLRVTETTQSTEGGDRVETTVVRDAAGKVASKTKSFYRTFSWGEERVKEVGDPDGAALTTEWTYVTATTSGAYRKVSSIKRPDGFIESFAYEADISGRPTTVSRPRFKSWVVNTTYSASANDLNADGVQDYLFSTREDMGATAFSLAHSIDWGGVTTIGGINYRLRELRRATVPGAAWNAATNIRTVYRTFADGPFAGEVAYQLNPDGTLFLRWHTINPDGGTTTIEEEGATDALQEAVVDGARSQTVLSPRGQFVSSSVVDVASGRVLESQTVGQTDVHGRPLRILHLDGAEEIRSYCSSCGSVEQVTLRGQTVSYEFDALGRKLFELRRAGTTTLEKRRFDYDAAGRLTKTFRIDPTNGNETLLASTNYDAAGRVVTESSLQGGTTTYAYAFGAGNSTITTITLADGATRIESRGPSGALFKIAGTSVVPLDYDWRTQVWNGSGTGYVAQVRRYIDATQTVLEETSINFLGDAAEMLMQDTARSYRYFDAIGRLVREVDFDGVTTLYAYDTRGRQAVTATDLNANNIIDYSGTDRITRTLEEIGVRDNATVRRSLAQLWETENQNTPTTVSISESSVDGRRSWQTVRGITTSTVMNFDGAGGRTVTTTTPDGTVSTQNYFGDRLVPSTARHPSLGQLQAVTYAYNSIGQLISTTDARTGTTLFAYDASDRLHTVTTPDLDIALTGPGYDPQVSTYAYDVMGRVTATTQPDGAMVYSTYYPHGQLKRQWGARTYPSEYTYDVQLRVKTLTTWQDFAGDTGKATTTWNYDNNRGWLNNKRYSDNTGPTYLYKPSGRLQRRTWARGVQTTYAYNAAGDLAGVDYSDTTPDVTIIYDRAGRPLSVLDGSGSRTLSYHSSGQLQNELYGAGPLSGVSVGRTYDSQHRFTGVEVPGASSVGYAYDAASRLSTVTQGGNTASYGYVPNSSLVGSVAVRQNGSLRLTSTRTYDNLNRLQSIDSVPLAAAAISAAYTYNAANQRTKVTREDAAHWDYAYDALGQVISGRKHDSTDAPLPGHQFAWSYDDIGNRKTAVVNAQSSTYTRNLLNQYSSRTVPPVIDLLGSAEPGATVTFRASGGTPQVPARTGRLFYEQFPANNTTAPVAQHFEFNGVANDIGPVGEDAVTTEVRRVFLPRNPESYTHDADGNLTADARWTYTWDGENRLSRITARAELLRAEPRPKKIDYTYDSQSRRVQKIVTRPGMVGLQLQVRYFSQPVLQGAPVLTTDFGVLDLTQTYASAQWTGTLRVPTTGTWTLKLDESLQRGYRLWIDGVVRFSAWPAASDGLPQTVTLSLQAGRDYPFRLDCNGGNALVRLKWSGPGLAEQVVPDSATLQNAATDQVETIRYVYDGWNLLAELGSGQGGAPEVVRTHAWGTDLSGSRQGAGGVGGLLFSTVSTAPGSPLAAHSACYDGNGNVIAYVDMASGAKSATYDYNAFGETLISDGPAADLFPFKFSTKYTDAEIGLLYYGYRYYVPSTGRWLSRDPINESGSQLTRTIMPESNLVEESNLYRYVGNESVGRFDPWGLAFFAYRPLDSWVGKLIGVTGNKLDDRVNTMAAHEQLFFEDGKSPGDLGFFDDNKVRADKSPIKYKAGHDTGWSDCLMRKAAANVKPSPTFCLLGKPGTTEKYNCQNWADAVRAEYRRLLKDPQVVASCCPTDAEKKK